ncbi:MAG: hypothetical protein MHMPM18_000220 [Marteilia pararefringens]
MAGALPKSDSCSTNPKYQLEAIRILDSTSMIRILACLLKFDCSDGLIHLDNFRQFLSQFDHLQDSGDLMQDNFFTNEDMLYDESDFSASCEYSETNQDSLQTISEFEEDIDLNLEDKIFEINQDLEKYLNH